MTTGKVPAEKAGKLLATDGTPKDTKTVAASALSDAKKPGKQPPPQPPKAKGK
jgi:hypothetical protein